MTIGTYCILNVITMRMYYGSSKNIEVRFSRHKNELKRNKHHCIYLQRSYNKINKNLVKYMIVYFIDKIFDTIKDARRYEQRVLDEKFDKLYNVSRCATGGDLITYHQDKRQIATKISTTLKNMYGKMSSDEKKEKYGRSRENNGMYGKTHTLESRKIISEANKGKIGPHRGKKFSQETKNKMSKNAKLKIGDKNPFFGKHHTDNAKKRISAANKGQFNNEKCSKKIITDEGIIYPSLSEAARNLGVCPATVHYRLRKNKYKYVK